MLVVEIEYQFLSAVVSSRTGLLARLPAAAAAAGWLAGTCLQTGPGMVFLIGKLLVDGVNGVASVAVLGVADVVVDVVGGVDVADEALVAAVVDAVVVVADDGSLLPVVGSWLLAGGC